MKEPMYEPSGDVVELYVKDEITFPLRTSIVPPKGAVIQFLGVDYKVKAVFYAVDYARGSGARMCRMRAICELVKVPKGGGES